MRPAGGNHRTLRLLAERLAVPTDHFDPHAVQREVLRVVSRPIPLDRILVRGSTYNRQDLKRRLYAEGLKQRACELCGQGELWRGQRMSLILDHINGEATDNRLENLQIVCPNCAATLDTHCGKALRRPRTALSDTPYRRPTALQLDASISASSCASGGRSTTRRWGWGTPAWARAKHACEQ